MYKYALVATFIFLVAACNPIREKENSENILPGTDTSAKNKQGNSGELIDQTETLMRMVNFDTSFAEPHFKSLDFKRSYWISAECFNALVNKMNSDGLNGIKIYFGAEPTIPHTTSLQWIATKKINLDTISDFDFKFNLDPALTPEHFGIDLDKAIAITKREKFAELYRLQSLSNLSPGAKGTLDNVSSSCWFDFNSLKNVSEQLNSDTNISGLHLYIGAYYNGKDPGRNNRQYDVQTTLQIVATRTDLKKNLLTDDWDFIKEPILKVLNHAILCPFNCN